MRMPCDKRVTCPCPGIPLTNYSSEDPDRLVYLGRWYGYSVPPPSNIIQDPCATYSASTISEEDADICAQAANNLCETGQTSDSECDICQDSGASSGNLASSLASGVGFLFVADPNASTPEDPCCDPDVPAECCCNSDNSDPDDDPPPPGGDPDNPGQPTTPPTNPPQMYGNDEQTCTVECPDGKQFTSTVPANRVFSISKALANANAHVLACRQAEERKDCEGGGGDGCNCIVLCLDTPVDYQVGTAPEEGEEKFFEVIGEGMPEGLSMDASGKITGTPTEPSAGDMDVKITFSDGTSIVMHTCISVLGITTETLPDGEVDNAYAAQLVAAGSTGPYEFRVEYGMPTGLSLDLNTGQITGIPDTGGNYTPLFAVYDSCGNRCPMQLEISIAGTQSITIDRVYCPTDPSIYVDVNVSVWGSTTANQDDLNARAIALANETYAGALQAKGCGCTVLPSTGAGTNNFTFRITPGCHVPVLSYFGIPPTPLNIRPPGYWPANLDGYEAGFPPGTTFNTDYHLWWDCNFASLTSDVVYVIPLGHPQDTAHVILSYRHTGHPISIC